MPMITPTQITSATHQVSRLGPPRSILASFSVVSAIAVASRGAAPWLDITRPAGRNLGWIQVTHYRRHRQPQRLLPPNGLELGCPAEAIRNVLRFFSRRQGSQRYRRIAIHGTNLTVPTQKVASKNRAAGIDVTQATTTHLLELRSRRNRGYSAATLAGIADRRIIT